jgi:hypothetical protein
VRSLVDHLNSFPPCPPTDNCPPAARRQVSQLIYIVEQMAIDLRREMPRDEDGEGNGRTALARAFVCAAQLYVSTLLRQMPLRSHTVVSLTTDLMLEWETHKFVAVEDAGRSAWNIVVLWIQAIASLSLADHTSTSTRKLDDESRRSLEVMEIPDDRALIDQLQCIAWSEGLAAERVRRAGFFGQGEGGERKGGMD